MSKAKLYLIVAAALVCSLAFAAPALAWTHGNFSANTDACAGCHVAHAAAAPNLLKAGPTQTHFCFLCHGDGATSAPYDVEDGYTMAEEGGDVYESTAGGFVNQFVDYDEDNVRDAGESVAVTSRHNVWGFVYGDETGGVTDTTDKYYWIPGGSNQFGTNNYSSGGFVCASCHDPHDGGSTPDGDSDGDDTRTTGSADDPNPRLLRKAITVQSDTYDDLYVSFTMSTVGTFTYSADGGDSTVDSGVYRVTAYYSGSTAWCGACHNKFKAPTGSGETQYFGMYRHAFGVNLLDAVHTGNTAIDADPADSGTPVEYNGSNGVVACLSCHRAHSTVATVAGWATAWPRDATDPETGDAQGTTSALLRMNNRGVCYNCHGGAVANTPDL